MDGSVLTVIVAVMGIAGTISAGILGWKGAIRTAKQDTVQEVREDTTIRVDVEYIKRGIDDMRFEIREQGKKHEERINDLSKEVARIDESTKSAHKRIDRLEGKSR